MNDARWLAAFILSKDDFLEHFVRLEKRLLFSFYAIRKLSETYKITDACRAQTFNLSYFPCIKLVDYFNCHRISELYNLSSERHETRNVEYLCNQFIHSYVFSPSVDENGRFEGVYVASDKVRQHRIYFVTAAQIQIGLRSFAASNPTSLKMTRDEQTGQWDGQVT